MLFTQVCDAHVFDVYIRLIQKPQHRQRERNGESLLSLLKNSSETHPHLPTNTSPRMSEKETGAL